MTVTRAIQISLKFILFLSLFSVMARAESQSGYITVKGLKLRSKDGCWAPYRPKAGRFYEQCTGFKHKLITGPYSPLKVKKSCDDVLYASSISKPCRAQARLIGKLINAKILDRMERHDCEHCGLDNPRFARRLAAYNSCYNTLKGKGLSKKTLEAFCLTSGHLNHFEARDLVVKLLRKDPRSVEKNLHSFNSYCMSADSGIAKIEMKMKNGDFATLDFLRGMPKGSAYKNGCFDRIAPANKEFAEYLSQKYEIKRFTPIPHSKQRLKLDKSSDSFKPGIHVTSKNHALAFGKLFTSGAQSNIVKYNFKKAIATELSCGDSGLCKSAKGNTRALLLKGKSGKKYILPPLGPKTTPRLCKALSQASYMCWRAHNHNVQRTLNGLRLLRVFSAATGAVKGVRDFPKMMKGFKLKNGVYDSIGSGRKAIILQGMK